MEYLRWILLLLGIVVLAAVYFLSRRRTGESNSYDDDYDNDAVLFDREPTPDEAPANSMDVSEDDARSHVLSNLSHELETLNRLLGRKAKSEAPARRVEFDTEPEPQPEPDPEPEAESEAESEFDNLDVEPDVTLSGFEEPSMPNEPILGNLFEEEETEAADKVAESSPVEKIITFHICARSDEQLQGADLVRVFRDRGYEFGEMDIYHSRVDGVTVFSIVNMVEPGWFDPASMAGFTTPGISLFLQLPGPLTGEVAFDVLVSEARELGSSLNAVVLDASRSTLTLQMEQHLREEVKQFDFEKNRDNRS